MRRLKLTACISLTAVPIPPSVGHQQKCTERGQGMHGTWHTVHGNVQIIQEESLTYFPQFGWVRFQPLSVKWDKVRGN